MGADASGLTVRALSTHSSSDHGGDVDRVDLSEPGSGGTTSLSVPKNCPAPSRTVPSQHRDMSMKDCVNTMTSY